MTFQIFVNKYDFRKKAYVREISDVLQKSNFRNKYYFREKSNFRKRSLSVWRRTAVLHRADLVVLLLDQAGFGHIEGGSYVSFKGNTGNIGPLIFPLKGI